ncbi:MAG: site-specific integrase [Alistipes sp.]|nr:site-specific integrase [Alistipes sp.]
MGMNCIQNCSVRKGRIERGQMALAHNFGEGSLSVAKQQPRDNVGVVIRRRRESLGAYIARFVREMEQGVRLNQHSLHYSASTVKNYKGFAVQFALFGQSRCRSYNFSDIDLSFYDDFVAYFTSKNYSVNTIGRHIKELKIIMRAAREEGLHCNDAFDSRKFRVLTAEVENIYLTEAEIRAIAEVDLSDSPNCDIARDIFLVGCYTAQRFSDYSTIGEGNVRELASGQRVIDLKQRKTGNHVVIPVRAELQRILDKYGNRLPQSYEQKVNKHIKEVARRAGITSKVKMSYVQKGERRHRLVEKCDLVKTHTARRSGATNMYLAGVPTIAIMKITGHKTEREFMKYIKITEEQTAIELMNHPYFSGRRSASGGSARQPRRGEGYGVTCKK